MYDVRQGAYKEMFDFINFLAEHLGQTEWKNIMEEYEKTDPKKRTDYYKCFN